ncbi:MAG: ATP synthase F1 subunit epsilon [Oscillospiraceae bacterium]|jgi:F-type H+-transporting ATPase subunit epsilon|nr:ATP synthase F1 subunit epsilon [Oscillospiraceae bacterium]
MAGKLRLRVITPESVKLDEPCDMVIMRCTTGDMGILPRHEACSAILDYGVLRIINHGEKELHMAVFGGIVQVLDDEVTMLTNEAQWPEDIDRTLAEIEHEQAEKRLQEAEDDVEIQKQQVSLRRTLVQIEVSAYPLLNAGESDKK